MNVTLNDLNAINEFLFYTFIIGLLISFMFFSIARSIIKRIISKINFPYRIRTEQGYLYRSLNGTYVPIQRKKEIDFQRVLKRKEQRIRFHEYALKRLKES